ncbi:MBL fold metallo-hydrolase [Granulosicoccus antarcticus]|uniref:2,4-dinitroanisole O-demethylase subunit alpha n=1 Tax=Granulosicoccus antarcticus IMCC3135 TaxID=1192854 RepID=A0A2Z2NPQ7_9GAMM|nr:MBL fold metallo-hydrolase [Granulosicoccus antarcticus]ASJ73259.1 2,4-dinitroanisole O-demethylase subunit alpha [Granulosicoccus antarcticus IMCC3135]
MPRLLSAILLTLVLPSGASFAQDRAISNIAGDVYRFQNQFHNSIFVITDDGVVVTDPINAEAALWLRSEIGKLTEKPITHLIYSHSHADHASGGAAFGEVADVIAHKNAPDRIDGITPTLRVEDATIIETGGKTIELTPLGPGHGDDLMAMVVRPENVSFVVDAVAAKRLPFRDFANANVDDWTNQVRIVEALDFEILAGGHGPLGDKADVTDGRIYLEELREQVLSGLKSGKSVDELASSITMDEYKDWASYEQWIELNVRGMARHLIDIGAAE